MDDEKIRELTKEPKKTGKMESRRKPEWNMAQQDLDRWGKLFTIMAVLETRVYAGDENSVRPLFAILTTLYSDFRPLIFVTKRKILEKLYRKMDNKITAWEKRKKYNPMTKLKTELTQSIKDYVLFFKQVKQEMGLGIPTHKDMSDLMKWKKAMGLEL